MPFRIQNRVPRGQPYTVGIRMNQHREQLAKAIEAASIIPYSAFLAATTSSSTTGLGITPAHGGKVDAAYVHIGTQGTGAATLDLQVDGVSILQGGAVTIGTGNAAAVTGAVLELNITAAAKEAIAAKKRVALVLVGAASGPTNVTVDLHVKGVHNAAGGQ